MSESDITTGMPVNGPATSNPYDGNFRARTRGDSLADKITANPDPDEDPKGETYFGIVARPGINRLNIIAIGLFNFLYFIVSAWNRDTRYIILRDENYFNIPESSENTKYVELANRIAFIPVLIVSLFVGFLLDKFGRKATVVPFLALAAGCLFLTPFTSKEIIFEPYYQYGIIQGLLQIFVLPITAMPLVQDYVVPSS